MTDGAELRMTDRQKLWIKPVLILIIIALGFGAAAYFVNTRPVVQRAVPRPQALYVEATSATLSPARIVVSGMGTVVPSQQITLRSRVSGNVVSMSDRFVPGGRIAKSEELLRIDPRDFEIEVAKGESELLKARSDYEIEQGRQAVARQELELLLDVMPEALEQTDLALRKPQLHQAEAQVAIAESQLARARLDLERTVLTAPFDALVLERQVDLGAHVGSQDPLATLAATDEYWIEAAVPMGRLFFLDLQGGEGSPARVFSQSGGGEWAGKALRTLGSVDESSRMVRVLIGVKDPLGTGREGNHRPLILGDYVKVEIQGRDLGERIVLPRRALRRGDTVWVAADDRLEIRPVEIVWRSGEEIVVGSGLAPGETVILSDIAAPVPGMAVEVAGRSTRDRAADGQDETATATDSGAIGS
jgi:RND family efflux transporter MFP subunit